MKKRSKKAKRKVVESPITHPNAPKGEPFPVIGTEEKREMTEEVSAGWLDGKKKSRWDTD